MASAESNRTKRPICPCTNCQIVLEYEFKVLALKPYFRCTLKESEARSLIRGFVDDATVARAHLKDTLAKHGDIIMSRWQKMSQARRQVVLEQMRPRIAKQTGTDIRCLYDRLSHYLGRKDDETRKQFLLPWLSIERLVANASVLLALLHVRVEYSPHDWATFDDGQLEQPWKRAYLAPEKSGLFVSMAEANYGSVVEYQHDAAALKGILCFPQASLVLEAQAHLMRLLCNIVRAILHGADVSTIRGCSRWNLEVAKSFKHVGKAEIWSAYTNQPFSKPLGEGLEYIASLLRSRREELEDHLFNLQTSPAYLRRDIKEVCDLFGCEDPTSLKGKLGYHYALETLRFWEIATHEDVCAKVRTALSWVAGIPAEENDLRQGQEAILYLLEDHLQQGVAKLSAELHGQIAMSAEFKHFFHNDKYISPPGTTRIRACKYQIGEIYHKDALACYLIHLGRLGLGPCRQFEATELFEVLENHLQTNPEEMQRLPAWTLKILSSLAVYCEAVHHLSLYIWRWSQKLIKNDDNNNKIILSQVDTMVIPMAGQYLPPSWKSQRDQEDERIFVANFYGKPAPSGPKDMARFNESKSQRLAIEVFWNCIRNILQISHNTEISCTDELTRKLFSAVSIHSTPEYAEAVRKEEEAFAQVTSSVSPPSVFAHPDFSTTNNLKTTVKVVASANKVKTRGAVSTAEQSSTKAADTEVQAKIAKRPVPKHCLEIFHLMFPKTPEERCRNVGWDAFVHAMNHAGCIVRSCGGSAVRFELTDTADDQGDSSSIAIILHRPHPVAKINPIMLRFEIGSRLTRRFGWTREHFVLAGEEELEQPAPITK